MRLSALFLFFSFLLLLSFPSVSSSRRSHFTNTRLNAAPKRVGSSDLESFRSNLALVNGRLAADYLDGVRVLSRSSHPQILAALENLNQVGESLAKLLERINKAVTAVAAGGETIFDFAPSPKDFKREVDYERSLRTILNEVLTNPDAYRAREKTDDQVYEDSFYGLIPVSPSVRGWRGLPVNYFISGIGPHNVRKTFQSLQMLQRLIVQKTELAIKAVTGNANQHENAHSINNIQDSNSNRAIRPLTARTARGPEFWDELIHSAKVQFAQDSLPDMKHFRRSGTPERVDSQDTASPRSAGRQRRFSANYYERLQKSMQEYQRSRARLGLEDPAMDSAIADWQTQVWASYDEAATIESLLSSNGQSAAVRNVAGLFKDDSTGRFTTIAPSADAQPISFMQYNSDVFRAQVERQFRTQLKQSSQAALQWIKLNGSAFTRAMSELDAKLN